MREVVLRGCWQGFGNWKLICIVDIVTGVQQFGNHSSQTIWASETKEMDSIRYLCKYDFDYFENILYVIMYRETRLNST